MIKNEVNLNDGFFEGKVKPYSDGRSFAFSLSFIAKDYMQLIEDVIIDSFVKQEKFYLTIRTVEVAQRTLGRIYRFKVLNALTFKPCSYIEGTYMISANEEGSFKAYRDGDVYVENLRVGLTNIQLFDNPKYFNNIDNGVKVVKPEQMQKS